MTFTYPNAGNKIETVDHAPNFREIRIPKTSVSMNIHHFVDRFSNIKECSAVVTSIESRLNPDFKKVVGEESARARAIIFVSPFLYTIPKKMMTGKKVIYESYNAEYHLMKSSFSRSLLGRLMLLYVKRIEGSLSKKCDMVFAVSDDDRDELSRLYHIDRGKIWLSYNGIDMAGSSSGAGRRDGHPPNQLCIFIGSYHPPNIEAVDRIIKMASGMQDIKFLIAGGVTRDFIDRYRLKEQVPADAGLPDSINTLAWYPLSGNVLLIGQVSDEEKTKIFDAAGIALNPMLSGSGTNIKMLDYMASGIPIVTTPVGARGLAIENDRQAIICGIDEFPIKIRQVLDDISLYARLSTEGKRLVEEKYDWKKIADKMASDLEGILR